MPEESRRQKCFFTAAPEPATEIPGYTAIKEAGITDWLKPFRKSCFSLVRKLNQ
jgi:hypothetical protein